MSGWQLTAGLAHLRDQVNAAFPNRDKASDGTIGDAAHQAETSSHNPDDTSGSSPEWNGDSDSTPEVRAWDMDSDLRSPGVSAQMVVDHIRHLPSVSSVIRYIIYNRKIYKAANGWAAETYDGPSAHTEHIHFTGAFTQAADNNTSFNYRLEDLVALTADDIADIAAAVWNYNLEDPYDTADPKRKVSSGGWLRYSPSRNLVDTRLAQADGLAKDFKALAARPVLDAATVVAGVLAGLSAEAIAAAIPDDIAQQVAENLAQRLSA